MGRRRGLPSEMVMCSTCSGFVLRKMPPAISDPKEQVVEVVTEAEKMRDLVQAALLHGPFQEKEPAEATKEQWRVLRRRRMIMMETKRCPACSRSLLEMCPTCSRALSEKPRPDGEVAGAGSKGKSSTLSRSLLEKPKLVVEDKAGVADPGSKAGSKDLKKSSREESSELMVVLPSQGGKERKKIATEDEDARSVKKSKRNGSSSGLKKKAKSEDKEGSLSKKKAKRSSEMEGSGSKEAKTEGNGSAGGNGKTKMVTWRMKKKSLDNLLDRPRVKPRTYETSHPLIERMLDRCIAEYEVDREFREYVRRQYIIRGYAVFQVEVTDDEDE